MEKYKIEKTRIFDEWDNLPGKYFLVTDEDNLISHDTNPENGEPFSGCWTDDPEEYELDTAISILVSDVEDMES